MPPLHPSPSTDLRTAVMNLIAAEFTTEVTVKAGKLHGYAGQSGAVVGVYPMAEREGKRVLDQTTTVAVQFFLQWDKKITPDEAIDPTPVEAAAERLRERLYTVTHPYAGSSGLWDFRVISIDYDADPVGNITRFIALVQGVGQNFSETR